MKRVVCAAPMGYCAIARAEEKLICEAELLDTISGFGREEMWDGAAVCVVSAGK